MQMATEGWEKVLGGLATTEEAATEDDRRFFSQRFLQPFDGETGW